MSKLTPIIEQSFSQYAGAVLQSRALVDVRDCIKPSARQIFYCMYTDKFIHEKPFKKTLKAIGSSMRVYIHGDSSCEGVIMRAGQPFSLRYPLVEIEGSYGNPMETGNWAAPRYTSSRLSSLAGLLFSDINKNTIDDWRDNYDDTEKYPAVLPSKGFYNIVNGTSGIGIAMSSSIPQFNIKDVNAALIKLLWNENIDDEELICLPDFATGGILLNKDEVIESLKNGQGKSCKLRSVIEYNEKEKCLIVKEIPYGVYTNTICGQIEKLIQENCGIDRFNDLTGKEVCIKIYLSKGARPESVLKKLYKETSLQYHYTINFTMLDEGKYPKVFTWKEALQAYLNHSKIIYRRGYEFDLNKIENRIHIIEGFFIALANIDEVVDTIKKSSSTSEASEKLQSKFLLDESQAKAILDLKLARLAKLEVEKLRAEKEKLELAAEELRKILSDEVLFKSKIQEDLEKIAKKFGDKRRTQIMNIKFNEEEDEPIEEKQVSLYLSNFGNIYTEEDTTLLVRRRGAKGTKFKLLKNEYIIDCITDSNLSSCIFFSDKGKVYKCNLGRFNIGEKINVRELFNLDNFENIIKFTTTSKLTDKKNIFFFTKNGLIKKSLLEDYNIRKNVGATAIKLKEDDEIVNIQIADNQLACFLTKNGRCVIINTENINPVGRNAMGCIGIKLDPNDYVVSAEIVPEDCNYLIYVTKNGQIKKIDYSDSLITGRGTKGKSIFKFKQNEDEMAYGLPVSAEKDVSLISNNGAIKIKIDEIPNQSNSAGGVISKKLANKEYIIKAVKNG